MDITGGRALDDAVRMSADCLRAGGLVVFPTETVYGIAALASAPGAIDRLRELKSRPRAPFSIHIPDAEQALRYVCDIPLDGRMLIRRAWPGPLTVLLDTGGAFADRHLSTVPGLYESLAHEGRVGLRCPDHAFAVRLLAAVDGPVVAPSANLAGARSPRDASEVSDELAAGVDVLVDGGPARYGKDSTIVSFDDQGVTFVRAGVYDEGMISRMMRRKICFVCTGNTCRSPMAAGIAAKIVAETLGCGVDDLTARGIEIVSAGIAAPEGFSPTAEAIEAAGRTGADIRSHRSRMCTPDLIASCDLVLCMTADHVTDACRLSGDAGVEIRRLDPDGDIEDPVGAGLDIYCKTADRIQQSVRAILKGFNL